MLKLDFASPASVGIECSAEIASIDMDTFSEKDNLLLALNDFLPDGLAVLKSEQFKIPEGTKKHSTAALLWGFCYNNESIPAKEEKSYRLKIIQENQKNNSFGIIRSGMLAKNPISGEAEDYFKLYRKLYPQK